MLSICTLYIHILIHILYAVIAEVMEDVIVVRRKAAAAIPQLCGYCASSIVTSSFYLEFVRHVWVWLVYIYSLVYYVNYSHIHYALITRVVYVTSHALHTIFTLPYSTYYTLLHLIYFLYTILYYTILYYIYAIDKLPDLRRIKHSTHRSTCLTTRKSSSTLRKHY